MITVLLDEGLYNISVLTTIQACFYSNFNTHAFGYCVKRDVITIHQVWRCPCFYDSQRFNNKCSNLISVYNGHARYMYCFCLSIFTVVGYSLCTWAICTLEDKSKAPVSSSWMNVSLCLCFKTSLRVKPFI